MKIEIVNLTKYKTPKAFITKSMKSISKELKKRKIKLKKSFIVIAFVSESRIKKLNQLYRKKNKITDVLSFESEEKDSFGELVFCISKIKLQSKKHNLSYDQELKYCLLHGFLHLLGFDHEKSKKNAKIMFELQDNVFEELI